MDIKYSTFLIAFVSFFFSGCASITQGTSQTLAFNLEPKDALCNLTRTEDGVLGSVSGENNTIEVHKDKDDIIVKCKANGYDDKTSRIVSKASAAGVTGVLIDFGITDMITGAMYAYPSDITIVMTKTASLNDQKTVKSEQPDQTASQPKSDAGDQHLTSSQEARLKELKRLHDTKKISDNVYESEQKEILMAAH